MSDIQSTGSYSSTPPSFNRNTPDSTNDARVQGDEINQNLTTEQSLVGETTTEELLKSRMSPLDRLMDDVNSWGNKTSISDTASVCTQNDLSSPEEQYLKKLTDQYSAHVRGEIRLPPSESLRLRSEIDRVSKEINPEQQNLWGDYSAEEKKYMEDQALNQRRSANNLGILVGGPVFSALPALGRTLDAPEPVIEGLGKINADLAGAKGLGRQARGIDPVRVPEGTGIVNSRVTETTTTRLDTGRKNVVNYGKVVVPTGAGGRHGAESLEGKEPSANSVSTARKQDGFCVPENAWTDKSVFNTYPEKTTLKFNAVDDQVNFITQHVPGLPREQAQDIVNIVFSKDSSLVIGGSRIRGDFHSESDIDIGFGGLNANQAGKLLKKLNSQYSKQEGFLTLESTRITPGNSTPTIKTIKSAEEFFQRSGMRVSPDPKAGQPYVPSGSITLLPDGMVTILPPGTSL